MPITTTAVLHREPIEYLEEFPSNVQAAANGLANNTLKKTRYTSHINFVGRCIRKKLIPRGFQLKFNQGGNDQQYVQEVSHITNTCSRQLMQATIRSMRVRCDAASEMMSRYCHELRILCNEDDSLNKEPYTRVKFSTFYTPCDD